MVNRGYYGTVRHNTRAVYQRYMGFYDANPSTLDQLPPEDAAKKYVDYMGGAAAVLQKARADFDKGEYRWVAEAVKHVVFADPNNKEGKELLADTYEQMGYQAESGPWRSVYLQGALRAAQRCAVGRRDQHREPGHHQGDAARDDVRLLRGAAERRQGGGQEDHAQHRVHRSQEALFAADRERRAQLPPKAAANADAKITLTKTTLDRIQLGEITPEQAVTSGEMKVEGRREAFADFVGMLDKFPFWFNIVTP